MRKLRNVFFSILLCSVLFLSFPLSSFAKEEKTETDTENNSLTISTTEEFLAFSENCRLDSFSKDLIVSLEVDIDLTDVDFNGIPIFSGTFEGNGHRIKGFSLTGDGSNQGLFRYLEETAIVRNLIIEGKLLPEGSRSIIGGLAGNNAGHIENCVFSGSVTGTDNIGGLVGMNELTGIIENCQVYGTIHGDHFVGGIAGENYGVIRNCSNLTKINTTAEENSVEISDITLDSMTSSESAVTATDIGGITGSNNGVVKNCENHGNIGYQHIGYNIGGIAGSQSGYITGCTNYADILGRKEVGGIAGQMEPASTFEYKADTFQILEGQLNTLSVLADNAASNAQNTSASNEDLDTLSKDIDTAQKALDQMGSDDGMTDPDSMIAAQNNLASSLSNILETTGKIADDNQEVSDALSSDMEKIFKQVSNISSTLSNATSTLGGSFTDMSDKDTDDNTIGKIYACINLGSIQADLNAGGIAGAITLENDLDPENDIDIKGHESLNFDYEVRAVIRNCENQGIIEGKRQNVGGIAGYISIGLIHSCTNTGKVNATGADYVGGISGRSDGYIRNCNTKCIISGSTYVGGISGLAYTVSDCRSMVQINDATETVGAILGMNAEDSSIENNYYLPVNSDFGGIDGISYEDSAKALNKDEFFALENLPDMFQTQTLRFIFDGGSSKNITVDFGERINVSDIPSVPKKEGYRGAWDGYAELISSEIVFDASFKCVYTPLKSTIESRETGKNNLPLLLAQGEFVSENSIALSELSEDLSLSTGDILIEQYGFTLPKSNTDVTLRYLLPEEYDAENVSLFVRDSKGTWYKAEYTVNGSYLVFSIMEGDNAFYTVYNKSNHLFKIALYSAVISIFAVIIVTAITRKRKNRK